jgi:hypothetical protein
VPVELSFTESDPRTLTPISDLSRSGVFVHTAQSFPLGVRIKLRFVVLPEDPTLFEHTGVVRRIQRYPKGVGVEFDPLSPDRAEIVDRVIARAERVASRKTRRDGRQRMITTRDLKLELAPKDK